MGEKTAIGWTDASFNPWWGCSKVSAGCEHCYADTFAKRVGHGKRLPTIWGPNTNRKFFGDDHWNGPRKWNAVAVREGRRRRVFCASMADVFEDRPDLIDHRARLFRLIEATTSLDWLLLTKRPENVQRLAAECTWFDTWPENVWLGTTAEDQRHADKRIPTLLATRGPTIRFVSYEPALGPVDLRPFINEGLDWVIVGGESGSRARVFNLAWARNVVRATRGSSCAAFVKQMGTRPVSSIATTSGRVQGVPLSFRDRAGADWSEWPDDLRVREWPVGRG